MADTEATASSADLKPTLHPAYSVTNINSKIRTLDGSSLTYSQWTKLFMLHAMAYKVVDHIDETEKPTENSDGFVEWKEIDALVLHWIYSTLSKQYLDRMLELKTIAREIWVKLENIFLNNKSARAGTSNQHFSNSTLGSFSSLTDYLQKLKEIASQLTDVGQPVDEPRLVTQLVQGLPPEYAVAGALIHQLAPSWDDACTMLHHEEMRIKNQNVVGNSSAVLAATTEPSENQHDSRNQQSYLRGRGGRSYHNRGGRGSRNSQRGQGRTHGQQYGHQSFGYNPWPPHASWSPPPTPYPSLPPNQGWPSQHLGHGKQAQQAHYASFPTTSNPYSFYPPPPPQPTSPTGNPPFAGYSDYNASILAHAMQHVNLNQQDPWHMDTGASTHLTSDPGFQDWGSSFPPQQHG